MEASAFTARLGELSAGDIAALAVSLRHELDSADGEVAWWRATFTVSEALRRLRLTRQAGLAAHDASVAVLRAATRTGVIERDRDAVTLVARAASEAARALVAGARAGCIPTPRGGGPLAVLIPWLGAGVLATAA